MNKFKILTFLITITLAGHLIASDVSRPKANNKIGHSKNDKDSNFFKNLINKEARLDNENSIENNNKIINQIKMLSKLKDEGVISETEFQDKKTILLNKIK